MTMDLHFVAPDIFTVADVLTKSECTALIKRAESIGFKAASVRTRSGPKMMTHIRNNDRVNFDDPELAALMWSRISHVLPAFEGEVPVGVDDRLRFYRYEPGQVFRRHRDGSVTNDRGHTSKLSFLIYLNEGLSGGATTFFKESEAAKSKREVEAMISPSVGTALLFRHRRWHEGSPVTTGRKYVLRSDVFYCS